MHRADGTERQREKGRKGHGNRPAASGGIAHAGFGSCARPAQEATILQRFAIGNTSQPEPTGLVFTCVSSGQGAALRVGEADAAVFLYKKAAAFCVAGLFIDSIYISK